MSNVDLAEDWPYKPLELHLRDCSDNTNGHLTNGLNNHCMCPCHEPYIPKDGETHVFHKEIIKRVWYQRFPNGTTRILR